MTREKEVNRMSIIYASHLCNVRLDYDLCQIVGMECPQSRESITGFSEGIKWADKEEDAITNKNNYGKRRKRN